jgi:hypothetical protein
VNPSVKRAGFVLPTYKITQQKNIFFWLSVMSSVDRKTFTALSLSYFLYEENRIKNRYKIGQ